MEAAGAALDLFNEILERIATEVVQPTSLPLDNAGLDELRDLLARLEPPGG